MRIWALILASILGVATLHGQSAGGSVVTAPGTPETPVTPVDPTILNPVDGTQPGSEPPPSLWGVIGGGTVELGQKVVLDVEFYGSGAGFTYQWRKGTTPIAGATNETYVIQAAAASDQGSYAVTVKNSAGESVASTELNVRPAAAPTATAAANAYTAYVGQTGTFWASATGSYPRTYQWRKDGTPIAGATADRLTLTDITTADAGSYSYVVSNAYGSSTSSSMSLTVNAAVPIQLSTSSPYDQTLTEGATLSLSAWVSSGSEPFKYQWYKDGVAIAGATKSEFRIEEVAVSDAGKYSAGVTNPAGTVRSREAVVQVNPATPPVILNQPQSRTVYVGQPTDFSIWADGTPTIKAQWYKDGVEIAGATSASYRINSAKLEDAGDYTVKLTNRAGTATSVAAKLTVKPAEPPVITTDVTDREVTDGDSVSFHVYAQGTEPMTYQWHGDGAAIQHATGSSYSFTASITGPTKFHLVVKNAAGEAKSRTATVTVHPRPAPPVVNLGNTSFIVGRDFELSPSLWGSGYTYQWYKDGAPIAGATDSRLSIRSATAETAGAYFVVVSNSGGSTASRTSIVRAGMDTSKPPGAWISHVRRGDVVYFGFQNPARIERFDLQTDAWLPTITLSRSPHAFTVSDTHLFIANGSVVYRYNLDGTGEVVLNSAFDSDVRGLIMYNDLLLVAAGATYSHGLHVVNPSDGVKLSSGSYSYYWSDSMAVAPTVGRVFSRSSGISPADITYATIGQGGVLSGRTYDSQYHGDYPDAKRVFVSPDQKIVVDDGGTAYWTSDLTYAASVGTFTDADFTSGNDMVVLRAGSLNLYSPGFDAAGQMKVDDKSVALVVKGRSAHTFSYPPSGGSIGHAKYSLDDARMPQPRPAVDASTVGFSPNATFLDRDGILYLYSKVHGQLFRWSPVTRDYLPPIPLIGWPDYVTYSSATHRVYTGYSDASIYEIRLDSGSLMEKPFSTVSERLLGLAAAGEYVFAADPSGAWSSNLLFGPEGNLVASREWSYIAADYVWNPILRRMYQLREDDLLYTEITAAGAFGVQKDSPSLGNSAMRYPIRISPDGGSVLLGSGKFFDATSMTVNNSLPTRIDDAAWVNARLFTARRTATGIEIQRWGGSNYGLDASAALRGGFIAMHALPNSRLLVVTVRNGGPYYTILDENLAVLSNDAGMPPPRLRNLATRAVPGEGEQTLIPGFVVRGDKPKRILVRAAGPALVPIGVTSGYIPDPQMTVYDAAGKVIATNDDWSLAGNATDISSEAARIGAFPFSSGSKDAAVLLTLEPGNYTALVNGKNGNTGVTLVEAYDLDADPKSSRVINMATRGQVGIGGNVMIPGFVVSGNQPKTVLVRAVGPRLKDLGIANFLADPKMKMYRGSTVLFENDNWEQSTGTTSAKIAAAAASVGAFALEAGSKDAALLVTLEPGDYTVIVNGANDTTGVALVEVYEIEP